MKHFSSRDRLVKFEELFLKAQKIYLAVSYIRDSGVKIIRPLYQDQNKEIKILLDTKMNISEKKSLKILLEDKIELKSYQGYENYHPKLFLFYIDNKWKAVIGSMNLTRGGLIDNIEYGIFLDENTSVKECEKCKKWFDDFWKNKNSKKINENFINNMPIYERLVRPKAEIITNLNKQIEKDFDNQNEIKNFIKSWATDEEKEGQYMRKNGWRFRPAQGEFNKVKLIEIKEILKFAEKKPIKLNDDFCQKIFKKYKTFQSKKKHVTDPTGLFIRTYKNYMDKLGIINYIKNKKEITLKEIGKKYINTPDNNLKPYLIRSMTEFKWFGVPIKDYLFQILEYTDKKLTKNEILLFVKHAGIEDYKYYMSYDIAKLVLAYRKLEKKEKKEIKKFAEEIFTEKDTSKSKTSWMNMEGNGLNDLINDFSNFDEIKKNDDDSLELIT